MVREKPLELKFFSNDIVEALGTLKTPVRCNNWETQKAKITLVADCFDPSLDVISLCKKKQSLAKEFPELISRFCKSKHHTVNSKFHRNYHVTHQKGRIVPIHLQPKVKIEL